MNRRRLLYAALAAAIIGFGGFLVAWSGIINVGASTGHWAVTEWALHFAMRQSVQTHAMAVNTPDDLDAPALVLRGAGHYATGCASCHGAPGQPRSPIALAMTPPPPDLSTRIDRWEPAELFWIVRHGVKFSAMPAWVALGRTDEVWAMVAFLLRLPDLDQDGYRELAFGGLDAAPTTPATLATGAAHPSALAPPRPIADALDNCARCHGEDGAGRGIGAFPRLTGQNEAYLLTSLQAYAEGARHSGIMRPAAKALSADEMAALAKHFASADAPVPALSGDVDGAALALGREIARSGAPADGVPACAVCHGPGPGLRHPLYPDLAGQYADYLELQLWAWREGVRGGTPFAHIMRTIAERMSEDQIRAVSAYYQSLTPAAEAP